MPHSLRMAELIGALSYALDMTEGQPPGHCTRTCGIGMFLADQLGLAPAQKWELYYTLLLKDLGCSSNAARICELYGTDDRTFKHDYKYVDGSLTQVLNFVLRHTGVGSAFPDKVSQVLAVLRNGSQWSKELILTRCERGADIARQLRFSEAVADGIHALDEHWNGQGKPYGRQGEEIPLYARIALLAQVADVFFTSAGQQACLEEIAKRSGSWFDPALAELFVKTADDNLWALLQSPTLQQVILDLEPAQHRVTLDEDYIDQIAEAFGQVVDSKSSYTAGHSRRVALITELLGNELNLPAHRLRWLRRGALLHDVGKLGVSNSLLDKPGRLTEDEFNRVKDHARFTGEILSRIKAFRELADIAQAHHERLDGKGYPLGLCAAEITLETRIITTADIFDAITAPRPYRGAIPVPDTLEMMAEHLHTQIDPDCYAALVKVAGACELTTL